MTPSTVRSSSPGEKKVIHGDGCQTGDGDGGDSSQSVRSEPTEFGRGDTTGSECVRCSGCGVEMLVGCENEATHGPDCDSHDGGDSDDRHPLSQ